MRGFECIIYVHAVRACLCVRVCPRVCSWRYVFFICLYIHDHSIFQISLLKAAKTAMIEDVRRCLELGANPNTLNQVRSSTRESANNQSTNSSHE